MTIYDAAPAILGLAIAVTGYTVCKIEHDRVVAARDLRRALARRVDRLPD